MIGGILGHSDGRATAIYAKFCRKNFENSVNRISLGGAPKLAEKDALNTIVFPISKLA